jgi:hypothetical protein
MTIRASSPSSTERESKAARWLGGEPPEEVGQ